MTEHISQFGWPGDDGLGRTLIERIKAGKKTATCCPIDAYSAEERAAIEATALHDVIVVDGDGIAHCRIHVLEVFTTPWGDPDPRLVRGEGFASAAEMRAALEHVWDDMLLERGAILDCDSLLLVELFELAGEVAGRPA